uniref:Tetratricopeptide repeat protein 7 N-terminal domain-containing protein n=1 Tax=Setaria digitata TaxID=48799 RepID=A0A915PVY3_9BILA
MVASPRPILPTIEKHLKRFALGGGLFRLRYLIEEKPSTQTCLKLRTSVVSNTPGTKTCTWDKQMSSKLRGSRLEAEVDKCRSECNWRRLGDVLVSVRSKNSGMQQYGDLLQAEYIIESFIDQNSELLESKVDNKKNLEKAAKLLNSTLQSSLAEKATVHLEANLLLAKLHYYCAEYAQAMKDIENSRLEFGDTPFESLRDLRLVAEAYAIKGFSIEATMKHLKKPDLEKSQMRALFCFEKSAELAISYVQELEKSISLRNRSGLLSSSANGINGKQNVDRMGELLETTLERVPLLRLRHNLIDRPWDGEGVEWYRRIMTSLGDKVVGEKLQQRLSRQLAEVLIRGMPDSDYMESQSVSTKSQNLRFYTGSHRGYFSPASRIEEILLLLLISEVLATKDVVLSRAEELADSRQNSLRVAKSVYNLLTLVLSALRQYELLSSIHEKAMKFANEDKYLWFQFALTLLCHGRYIRASRILTQCLAIEQYDDSSLGQHLFAASVAIEHLGQYDEAISHAEKAFRMCEGNWLSGRCLLLKAIALSMKAETLVRYSERSEMQLEVIKLFENAAAMDPHDDLVHYYCARQYAIARDLQTARDWCEKTLELNPEMPSAIMLLALIFTAQKDYKAALELIVDALEDFPTNYPLTVLKLMLEVKFSRVDEALSSSQHLLFFWKSRETNLFEEPNANLARTASEESQKIGQSESLLRSVNSRDAVTATPFIAAASLGILSSSALASMSASVGTGDATESGSVYTTQGTSDYGTSTVSVCSRQSKTMETHFMIKANIWLELAELFLDLNRMDDVRPCIEEASSLYPCSYQALYIKGRLLAARAAKCENVVKCEHLRSDAKASLLGALAIAPSHVSSLRHLACIYRLEGNIPMAEKMLRDVVQIDPLHNDSWQALGMILSEDGRFEEALECYSIASALNSSTPLIPFSALPILIRTS